MSLIVKMMRVALMVLILAPTLLLSDSAFAAGHPSHPRAGATTGAR